MCIEEYARCGYVEEGGYEEEEYMRGIARTCDVPMACVYDVGVSFYSVDIGGVFSHPYRLVYILE